MFRLPIRRPLRRTVPIQVELHDGVAERPRRISFDEALRLGYGKRCEVRLEGESGPELVCSLERAHGPLRLSTPLPHGDHEPFDLLIDGRPLQAPAADVGPGSQVEVFDHRSGRRYRLRIGPRPPWFLRPRWIVAGVATLALAGLLFGLYFAESLRTAEERLRRTEASVEESRTALQAVQERIAASETEFGAALRELRAAQADSERALRADFDRQLATLTTRARAELARLSEEDVAARTRLQSETRAAVQALRDELGQRMVDAYQAFKQVEQKMMQALGARLEAAQPVAVRFKRVYQQARPAVVFVRVSVDIEFLPSGESTTQELIGTGFLIAPDGLLVTAQHVLYPWHYDRELQVLMTLGLVRVHEDTLSWSFWTTGERVLATPASSQERHFELETAWRSDSETRGVRLLYAPPIELTQELVEAPVGFVAVSMPVPGASDIAVLQLMQFEQPFPTLALSLEPMETLDEVLAVGYPLGRLGNSLAEPQAVIGFVRRSAGDLLELDSALNPGLSGGPMLDAAGRVVGMAIATLSAVYGVAIGAGGIDATLAATRASVLAEERRLSRLGCDPGEIDGRFDAATAAAYRCEQTLGRE